MTLRKLKHFIVTNRHFVSERVLDAQKSLEIYNPNQSSNIESTINSESNTINEK